MNVKKLMSILIGCSLIVGTMAATYAQTGKSSQSIELMKRKRKKPGKKNGPY